ncbi:uncharacterized protein [Triticum aestivum]|uniref:uncharacterized protein isoform X3 n=1 Tax=Triticum aestivum TaxID=4565 RepID=UPI001D030C11|nr:uncharacterized protein LOC123060955 isoform X3 [Triticum aestivum]
MSCKWPDLGVSVDNGTSLERSDLQELAAMYIYVTGQRTDFLPSRSTSYTQVNYFWSSIVTTLKRNTIASNNPLSAVKGGTADLFKKKGKFEYSLITFWATREGSNSAATDPVLFFAECSNDDEDDKETPPLCVPVFSSWISDVRCFHCEFLGKKIVHPYHESYYGRYEDFVGMAHGDHSICNEEIISACDFHADMMCTLKEDWIFFYPNMDAMIARANPIKNWATEMLKWENRIF